MPNSEYTINITHQYINAELKERFNDYRYVQYLNANTSGSTKESKWIVLKKRGLLLSILVVLKSHV
jgi:hypothetical protein